MEKSQISIIEDIIARTSEDWVREALQKMLFNERYRELKTFGNFNPYSRSKKDNELSQYVFYEDGYRVYSDQTILMWEKMEYPEEFEGKCILKDGGFAKRNWIPRWKRVVNFQKPKEEINLNFEWMLNAYSHFKAMKVSSKILVPVTIKDTLYDIRLLMDFHKVCKEFGFENASICSDNNNNRLMAGSIETKGVLICPMHREYDSVYEFSYGEKTNINN